MRLFTTTSVANSHTGCELTFPCVAQASQNLALRAPNKALTTGRNHSGTPLASDVTTYRFRDGAVPPGKLDPLYDVTTMLDTIDAQGNRLFVSRGTRMPGTRVAIHVHEYGGHACVVSGTITDFVEGQKSSTFPAGTCYYMPPNTPMTAANLGTEPAVLIDNFTLPSDAPMITILEPGWDDVVAQPSQ